MNRYASILIKVVVISVVFLQPIKVMCQANLSQPIFIDLAQLDEHHNQLVKNKSSEAVKKLIKYSVELLDMKPLSVMDKSIIPPSGDKHDFTSMGPYWWPDPNKPDGLPYIRRDGERNPEYYKITDESYLGRTIEAVYYLTNAYYITKDSKYAGKAAELLRVWFLNDETKMNPNMNHAQFIPGINTGRGIGLIETRELFKITDALILLRNSELWKKEDDLKIGKWFEEYYSWITNQQYGIDESNEQNNHGTWYDVQKNAIAIFLGKLDDAKKSLEEAKHKRIDSQIEADGKQPLELARTKSWNYSLMNLSAFMHLAILGEYVGVDLWNYQSNSGGSIRKALDYLLQYAQSKDKWEYKQISQAGNESLYPLLKLAEQKYDERIYSAWSKKIFGDVPFQGMFILQNW